MTDALQAIPEPLPDGPDAWLVQCYKCLQTTGHWLQGRRAPLDRRKQREAAGLRKGPDVGRIALPHHLSLQVCPLGRTACLPV